MEKFKVKKDSWHYTFLDTYIGMGGAEYYMDFCTYWRKLTVAVVFGIPFAIMAAVLFITLLVMVPIIGILGFVLEGVVPYDVVGAIMIAESVFLSMLGVGYLVSKAYRPVADALHSPLIAQKYSSYKEKYCPLVDFVE
jgi:hypothetical protein